MRRIAWVIMASIISFSAMAQENTSDKAAVAVSPPAADATIEEITCACETDVNGLFVAALDFIRKADKPGVLPLERYRLYGLAWKRFERIIEVYPDSWVAVRLLANQPIGGFQYWNFKRKYRLASVEACGLEEGAPGDCPAILAEHVAALVLELQNTENRVIEVQTIITRMESTFSTQISQLTQISQEVGKLRAEAAAFDKEKRDLLAQMAEIQSLAGVPGGEDRPQRTDHLLHPGDRAVELGAVALLDLRADLRAQAQDESPLGQQLQIVGLMSELNRVAGECDRDVGHHIEALDRRRQYQRGEDVEGSFEGEHTGCAGFAQEFRPLDRICRPEQRCHDLHVRAYSATSVQSEKPDGWCGPITPCSNSPAPSRVRPSASVQTAVPTWSMRLNGARAMTAGSVRSKLTRSVNGPSFQVPCPHEVSPP